MSGLLVDWPDLEAAARWHGWTLAASSDGYRAPWTYTATRTGPDGITPCVHYRAGTDGDALRRWVGAGCPACTENAIITGDARILSPTIPDGVADLVFTDPVYQNLDDYAWLARESLRVLRPRGAVLAWCSVPKLGVAQRAMEDAGLEYVYTLFYTVVAKTFRMRWYNLFCWTTPCLWMQRPGEATRPSAWMPDTFADTLILDPDVAARLDNTVISAAGPTGTFAWNKNTGVLVKWLTAFCAPGGLVWDPFTGTGSVPVAARMTGRRFLASEIDPARADEARARLAATPITPITAEDAVQLSMEAA